MKKLIILGLIVLLTACSQQTTKQNTQPKINNNTNNNQPSETDQPKIGMANPASTNCVDKGGNLQMEERADLGTYGVCYFEDNRQCEEWALLRGDCPQGGLKVTGYITDAARFCAITGGSYTVTNEADITDTSKEAGTCTFKNGKICDVWEYWEGKCNQELEDTSKQESEIDTQDQVLAQNWIKENATTYLFDGYNLEFVQQNDVRCPSCNEYIFKFQSRQAGYGDRTNQVTAQVITPHTINILVENGKVTSAITDETYDEIKKNLLDNLIDK